MLSVTYWLMGVCACIDPVFYAEKLRRFEFYLETIYTVLAFQNSKGEFFNV